MSSKAAEGKGLQALQDLLKDPELAGVLSEGLAVLHTKRPKNPVEYLALWLLNTANEQKLKQRVSSGRDRRWKSTS
jgi:hypothetical protein